MPLVSHLITCQAPSGPYHQEDRAGLTFEEAVRFIVGGTSYPLISVHAVDFSAGAVTDVTCAALHGAVDWWHDRYNEDVPGCLWTACDVYGVERYEPEAWSDENDEHRLVSADLGIQARAA